MKPLLLAAAAGATLLAGCTPLPPARTPASRSSAPPSSDDILADPCEQTEGSAARKRCRDMYEQARKDNR